MSKSGLNGERSANADILACRTVASHTARPVVLKWLIDEGPLKLSVKKLFCYNGSCLRYCRYLFLC